MSEKRDRKTWMRKTHVTAYIPPEIEAEARRLNISVSHLLARAWRKAYPRIRKCPAPPLVTA